MFTYIANWKMTVSYEQALSLLAQYHSDLGTLSRSTEHTLVLCPSFPSLGLFSELARKGTLFLGAQDCSPYTNGPYTGDVDALSLKQIGCTYCIVGHSERRRIHKETPELVAQKVAQLQLTNITPVVCIGETEQEKQAGKTLAVLQAQLTPVLTVSAGTEGRLYIAYEPVWAIGSGKQPTMLELTDTIAAIKTYCATILRTPVHILYGGSVTTENIGVLKKVLGLEGVLIGSASTDFNSLKKIVS